MRALRRSPGLGTPTAPGRVTSGRASSPPIGRRRRRHPTLRLWLLTFAALLAASAAWSLATPLGGAPDEPAHIERAAAAVRGQLTGTAVHHAARPGSHPALVYANLRRVRVPAVFSELSTF